MNSEAGQPSPVIPGLAFQAVIGKYSDPKEIEALSRGVQLGLTPFEQALVDQYLQPHSRVLDVGCGAGREAIALSQQGHFVTGVDTSPPLIASARGSEDASRLVSLPGPR